MKTCNYQKRMQILSSNLGIANVELTDLANSTVEVAPSVNHIFCVDISGSMYETLPKMRQQLKNKLPDLVGEGNTITIVWFSGPNECGILKEFVNVKNVSDLKALNNAIDTFLKPMGLTSFYEPIEVTNKLISSPLVKPDSLFNFIFMSDGGNNSHPWEEVMTEVHKLTGRVSGCTILEYGYWADTDKLQEMADAIGGQRVMAENFDEYEFVIENALLSKKTPMVEVDISEFKSQMVVPVLLEIDEESKSIRTYDIARRTSVYLPENTKGFYYLQKIKDGSNQIIQSPQVYAFIYMAVCRQRYDLVEKLLKVVSDKRFIDLYSCAFGKQRLEDLKSELSDAVFDKSRRYIDGVDTEFRPNSNRYCILDLMDDILSSDKNLMMVCDPEFRYNRTSAKSKQKIILTQKEIQELSNTTTKLKADKILEGAAKREVKVIYPDRNYGVSVSNLIWNEERANLSLQVRIPVTLELPENTHGLTTVDSSIFRNFTIIKDGILNVSSIPMRLTDDIAKKLSRIPKLVTAVTENGVCTLDLTSLPIVNKTRVESVRMDLLASYEVDLLKYRTYKKYLGWLKKSSKYLNTGEVTRISQLSSEVDEYLKSLGITDLGYSPAMEKDYTGDFYMAPTLKSTISKFSSLPKIEDIMKKVADGKSLTVSQEYMRTLMDEIDSKIDNNDYRSSVDTLYELYDDYTKSTIRKIAQSKFALILSRRWFCDKSGFDDNTCDVRVGDSDQTIKFEFRDQKIPM